MRSLAATRPRKARLQTRGCLQLASEVVSFTFENLDRETRGAMIAELDGDLLGGGVFLSPRLTPEGAQRYPDLLRAALTVGEPVTLEESLSVPGILERFEWRRGKQVTVASNAARLIAECEFNRYYMRGVCSRVVTEGGTQVQVYRARESTRPRPGSQLRIGTLLDAATLLDDLRRHADGTDPTILPEINSGLSVRIPD
jgi:hypothetical protein